MFLNVRGREPQGCVEPRRAREALRARLAEALRAVRGPGGERWHNRVESPESLYRAVRGDAPDLLAFFDELSVRALSIVGSRELPCRAR